MNTADGLDGRALLAIAIALVTWSSAYAAIAYALPAFTPGEITLARLLIGSLCFAVLLRARKIPLPARRDWPQLAILGVLGLTIYHLCLNYAQTRIASGTASILIALIPAATAAVSALWLRERLPWRTWLGLVVALIGTVTVVLASGKAVSLDPRALLILGSVLAAAIFFVGQKPLFRRSGMLGVTAFTFFAATVASLPFGWHLPQALGAASWPRIWAILWLGVAPTFVGYLAWNMAVHRASASRVSSFIYLSPPIALLIGWLWLDEVPNALIVVGGLIIIGGVILANVRRASPQPPTVAPAHEPV